MEVLRLCLDDKSSVLIVDDMDKINIRMNEHKFIKVTNYSTKKEELYNTRNIWCVRKSHEQINK